MHEVFSSYQVPAQLSVAHHQLSSAQQRTVALAQQRCAMCCRAVLCRIVPRYVLCCIYSFVQARYHSKYHTRYYTRFVRSTFLNHTKCAHSQLISATAQQRSEAACDAVWCRVVPCVALRCGAVLGRGALCFLSTLRYHVSCAAPGTGMYVSTRLLAFFN